MPPGTYHFGLIFLIPTNLPYNAPYEFNRRFRLPRSPYVVDNEVIFPSHPVPGRIDNDGRRYTGHAFATGMVIHKNSAHSMRYALTRLFGCRVNYRTDMALRAAQTLYVGFYWHQIIGIIQRHDLYSDMRADAAELVLMPHAKRQVRQYAWRVLNDSGDVARTNWNRNTVNISLKRREGAKMKADGTRGRVIVDLTVPASLQGAMYAMRAKKILSSKLYHFNGCTYEFCGCTRAEDVTGALMRLVESTARVHFLIYSDDSCLACDIDGRRRFFNLDISACDTSHEPIIFDLLFAIFNPGDELIAAFHSQMLSTMHIANPEDPTQYVRVKPRGLYLQSGSTNTTITNCVAQVAIFHALATQNFVQPSDVIAACARVGYIVTMEEALTVEQLQFLKMSLARTTTGEYRAMLNLGVILSASGSCKVDLPGRRTDAIRDRHNWYQTALMDGLLTTFSHPHINSLNPKQYSTHVKNVNTTGVCGLLDLNHGQLTKLQTPSVPIDAFYRRYDATPADWEEFFELLSTCQFGSLTSCRLATIVINKDNGRGQSADHDTEFTVF